MALDGVRADGVKGE